MRFIHEVLYSQAPELKNSTEVYLDGILIHTPDVATHKVVLKNVCQCLSNYNLGISLPKCVLGQHLSENNSVADALTRSGLALILELPKPIDFDAIAHAQEIDTETKSLSNAITSLLLKLLPVNNSYKETLCDVFQNEPRVILPLSFRCIAFDMIHSLSHAGIKSTLDMIKQKFFRPNINKDVKNWVSECNNCQRMKVKSHTQTPRRSFPRTNPNFR